MVGVCHGLCVGEKGQLWVELTWVGEAGGVKMGSKAEFGSEESTRR